MIEQAPPPTAFISYSWDDDTHCAWVRSLATRLRADGIEVTLDQWHLAPGDQLPAFMEQSVRKNEFVLVVCTPKYKDRSDNRKGGAGYEGDIMTAEVFNLGNNGKYLPLLRHEIWKDAAPSWLLGKVYFDFRSHAQFEGEYQKLLSHLHGDIPQAPPIGPKPVLEKTIPGLHPEDIKVLKAGCEAAECERGRYVTVDELIPLVGDMSREEIVESVTVLIDHDLVSSTITRGGVPHFFGLTDHGIEKYAEIFLPHYNQAVVDVAEAVVGRGETKLAAISEQIGQPKPIVEHVLRRFKDNKWIVLGQYVGSDSEVLEWRTGLKRWLQDQNRPT